MKNDILKNVAQSLQRAQSELKKLTPAERAQLEREWDLEHAYYSSALEGSKIDRKDMERLSDAIQ